MGIFGMYLLRKMLRKEKRTQSILNEMTRYSFHVKIALC